MNAALVIVQIPIAEKNLGLVRDYKDLLTNPKTTIPPTSKVEKLAENVWLIPLPSGLRFLAELIHELDEKKLVVQILQLGKRWSKIDDKPPSPA